MICQSKPRFQHRLHNQLIALGATSLTLRLVGDTLGKLLTPTVDDYFMQVVDDYQRDGPSFEKRWGILRTHLQHFKNLAGTISNKPPIFLILPIMVDFKNYPLTFAHQELKKLAESLGYEVIDLLPMFHNMLKDGRIYRVTPNDNHFDATVHKLVAENLKDYLDRGKLGTSQQEIIVK